MVYLLHPNLAARHKTRLLTLVRALVDDVLFAIRRRPGREGKPLPRAGAARGGAGLPWRAMVTVAAAAAGSGAIARRRRRPGTWRPIGRRPGRSRLF